MIDDGSSQDTLAASGWFFIQRHALNVAHSNLTNMCRNVLLDSLILLFAFSSFFLVFGKLYSTMLIDLISPLQHGELEFVGVLFLFLNEVYFM